MPDIVCVGICTVDLIAGPIDTWPVRGGLQLFDNYVLTTGGCAVNAAVDLAKLGLPVSLATKVGADAFGQFVLDQCRAAGVDVSASFADRSGHTPLTFVTLHGDGQRSFIHTMGTNATLTASELSVPALAAHRFCFVAGLALMPALEGAPLGGLLKQVKAAGKTLTLADTVYLESISRDGWKAMLSAALPHLDYFLPSWPEAQAITGCREPADAAAALLDAGAANVCIKLDSRGVLVRLADGTCELVPAYCVPKVVDTTGAGDSWCAGFLAGLSLGHDAVAAARLGNATAAFCIQAKGASTGIPPLAQVQALK